MFSSLPSRNSVSEACVCYLQMTFDNFFVAQLTHLRQGMRGIHTMGEAEVRNRISWTLKKTIVLSTEAAGKESAAGALLELG